MVRDVLRRDVIFTKEFAILHPVPSGELAAVADALTGDSRSSKSRTHHEELRAVPCGSQREKYGWRPAWDEAALLSHIVQNIHVTPGKGIR